MIIGPAFYGKHSFWSNFPDDTRRCDNFGFRLSFGRDVGQRRSNVVTPTKIRRSYEVVFSTSIFWSDTNVVVTLCFSSRFSDKNLTVYQRHYDCVFPKLCKLSFNSSFWSTELILYAFMQSVHSICYIFENLLFVTWTEKGIFDLAWFT